MTLFIALREYSLEKVNNQFHVYSVSNKQHFASVMYISLDNETLVTNCFLGFFLCAVVVLMFSTLSILLLVLPTSSSDVTNKRFSAYIFWCFESVKFLKAAASLSQCHLGLILCSSF